jgi:hypothetical protein
VVQAAQRLAIKPAMVTIQFLAPLHHLQAALAQAALQAKEPLILVVLAVAHPLRQKQSMARQEILADIHL